MEARREHGVQRMEKLNQDRVDERLLELDEWTKGNDKIQRTFAFDDFAEAMGFVNRIADHAEAVNHHPDILIRYSKVTLTLSTHDAGGLTDRDFEFATRADGLLAAQPT